MYVHDRRAQRPQPAWQAKPKKVKRFWLGVQLGMVVVVLALWWLGFQWYRHTHTTPKPTGTTHQTTTTTTQTPSQPAFNKSQYSLTDATSMWVVVNKKRPLNPLKYVPAKLVIPNIPLRGNITGDERYVSATMAPALEAMAHAASAQGVTLNLQSGYRSYDFQVNLFNTYVQQEGLAQANRESAHPGYSEHQTGLAADLGGVSNPACNVAACFASTTEGEWLAANAYQYGFIVRYPTDKEAVTGYEYEPWHVRYVGVDLATEMHNQGVETLEEFFGLGSAPSY